MADTIPAVSSQSPPVSPVAETSPGSPGQDVPASTSAHDSVPKFGGIRGGRQREDGLVPGSQAARQADRDKDAKRKRDARAAKKPRNDPPPLPSVSREANPPQTPPDGVGTVPVAPSSAPLPWEPGTLKPLFEQLIPTVEAFTVRTVTDRAEKANLPPPLRSDIARDAAWPTPAKKALEMAGPQLAAKWLNKSGISSENQPEVVCVTALAAIMANNNLILSKLDKLIAAQKEQPKPQAKS